MLTSFEPTYLQAGEYPEVKFSRAQYLNNDCTHQEYYAQFIPGGYTNYVINTIGRASLKRSKDEHLNDIALKRWDALASPAGITHQIKKAGTYFTLSDHVCIAKTAAKLWLETEGKSKRNTKEG